MRKLLLLLLLVNYSVFAQLKIKDDKTVFYEEVIETDKTTKEVHDAVEEFLATNSGNSNYTIKINNEDQILSKGQISVIGPNKLEIVLNTEFKDGRYRILMDPISWNGKSPLTESMNFDKEKAKEDMKQMYIDKGMEKTYEKKDKKGEIDADIQEFVKMQTMLYDKSKEKIINFANSLKKYVSNKENSEW
ncbi:hypothetical protein [Christiangramia sp. OXR-203]|uniref:hypothetical protein n=1 Tax=Christiangramia sp. OXR-203 TaxID=3100176 RepID=UPI002AC903CA|nr:hypothetical protein [Christiangramia sp. OXR-203]WPY97612.1 hypothetical protein T8I65_10545 [Christiangramia sp. OXR-203]